MVVDGLGASRSMALKLIIISGLPGSGKSTLCRRLGEELMLPVLSVDPIESAILQCGFERSFNTGLAAYKVAEALASEQLTLGLSVIIDAVNSVRESRDMWLNLSKKHGAQVVVIECVLEPTVHKKRVESRVRNMYGIAELTWANVEARRKNYEAWDEKRLIVDTATELEANVQKSLRHIGSFA